jgi:hypothetical protein
MKINRNINTTIITDNNIELLKEFKNELIISNIDDIKTINTDFIVFNDVIRYLKQKDKERLFTKLEEKDIHYVNITSDIEEALNSHKLIIINNNKIVIEGCTISVLKEEKILKRLGIKLPFVVDLSLQLNYYGLINSMYLDEEVMVNKLW